MNIEELRTWVHERIDADLGSIIPKIFEYGSVDLHIMGQAMRGGEEQAIAFYLLGKVARAMSAYDAGHGPSDDSIKDALIYAIMLRFVHEHGHWGFDGTPTSAIRRTERPDEWSADDESSGTRSAAADQEEIRGRVETVTVIDELGQDPGEFDPIGEIPAGWKGSDLGDVPLRGRECRAPGPDVFCELPVGHQGHHTDGERVW